MKRIQIYEPTDVDTGLKKLTADLRRQGIPEKNVIGVKISHDATYFTVFIREDDELKLYEDMKKQINRADKLLHKSAMRFSSGQVINPGDDIAQEMNEYLADYEVKG